MFLGLKMVIAKPQWSSVRSSSFTDLVLAFRHVSSSSLSSQVSVFPARYGVVPPSLSCVSCPLARFLNPLLFLFAGAGSHGHAFELSRVVIGCDVELPKSSAPSQFLMARPLGPSPRGE
jgi:hypothetical protein